MGLIDEVLNFILHGNIGGIPTLAVMSMPLVIGLIVGFLAAKFLKLAIIIVVIIAVAVYLGFYSLDISTLQHLAQQYGPSALHLGAFLIGLLPLTIGFAIGAIIGFILG
ncbi:MAG TPA: hypothetical protein VGK23_08860 [Methanomassiliicoccales archaeon]|jgi:uncharacterized membrane protein (Fun14 family)